MIIISLENKMAQIKLPCRWKISDKQRCGMVAIPSTGYCLLHSDCKEQFTEEPVHWSKFPATHSPANKFESITGKFFPKKASSPTQITDQT